MPSPADTNCGVRLDSEHGNKRNHLLLLTDQQSLNQDNEPSAGVTADPIETAGPSVSVFQRTGDENTKRYRLLKHQIIAESKHTLRMSYGHLPRKSGLAIKKTPAIAKNVRKQFPKPPMQQDLPKNLAAK